MGKVEILDLLNKMEVKKMTNYFRCGPTLAYPYKIPQTTLDTAREEFDQYAMFPIRHGTVDDVVRNVKSRDIRYGLVPLAQYSGNGDLKVIRELQMDGTRYGILTHPDNPDNPGKPIAALLNITREPIILDEEGKRMLMELWDDCVGMANKH